jgi:hypothetical protein
MCFDFAAAAQLFEQPYAEHGAGSARDRDDEAPLSWWFHRAKNNTHEPRARPRN